MVQVACKDMDLVHVALSGRCAIFVSQIPPQAIIVIEFFSWPRVAALGGGAGGWGLLWGVSHGFVQLEQGHVSFVISLHGRR